MPSAGRGGCIGSVAAAAAAVGAAALAAYLGVTWERAYTPTDANTTVAELFTVPLNGQRHFATVRSRVPLDVDVDVAPPPVLLVLHGGPGASDVPYLRETDDVLERCFVVVHYDQRSAGKSCRFHDDRSSNRTERQLTIQRHVDDAVEFAKYLRGRFGVDRLYLLGGSWGSVLALLLARDHPEYFHHVAVRGLVVNVEESERLSWDLVRSKFPQEVAPERMGGGPPYDDRADDLIEQRKWLHAAGGMSYRCHNNGGGCNRHTLFLSTLSSLLSSTEYSWGDLTRFERCLRSTLAAMWPELQRFDAHERVPTLDVPLLVLHGRHDHCTAHSLVPGYVDAMRVRGGRKKLVWFERSGHSPQREEPEKFQRVLVEEFLGGGRE